MVSAALDGCRMALVGTGWPICHLASTLWHRNDSFLFVWKPFLVL